MNKKKPNRAVEPSASERSPFIPPAWEKIPGASSSRNEPPRSLTALRKWLRFERDLTAVISGLGAVDSLDAMRVALMNGYRSLETLIGVTRVFPPDPLNRAEFERAMTELLALVDAAMSPSPTPPARQTPTAPATNQYVRLDQLAAMVSRSKKAFEKLKSRSVNPLPVPAIEGGGGRPGEWIWSDIRPWLENEFKKPLPEIFPGYRR